MRSPRFRTASASLECIGSMITPIVIPLGERQHISDLVNRGARIRFDADGTGIKKIWTWITPDAGWLVHAPEKSRPITSALQMFGSVTFWLFWENGYQALRSWTTTGTGHSVETNSKILRSGATPTQTALPKGAK